MNKHIKLLILSSLIGALSACSTGEIVPDPVIQTPKPIPKTKDDRLVLAMYDGVVVKARQKSIYWDVFYINENSEAKCVITLWQFYEMTPKMPKGWTYVEPYTSVYVGYFKERTFEVDNIHLPTAGSARIDKFSVLDPYEERTDCAVPPKEVQAEAYSEDEEIEEIEEDININMAREAANEAANEAAAENSDDEVDIPTAF